MPNWEMSADPAVTRSGGVKRAGDTQATSKGQPLLPAPACCCHEGSWTLGVVGTDFCVEPPHFSMLVARTINV